jgi:hypothetical protein
MWEEYPDWRIGQLVCNVAAWSGKKEPGSVWDVENSDFSKTVNEHFEKKDRPHLLALQWPASSIGDYDRLIEIETYLIEHLKDGSLVDGHDAGSGEMNIFILTGAPKKAFDGILQLLSNREELKDLRVGYQQIGDLDYKPVWPEGLTEFTVA